MVILMNKDFIANQMAQTYFMMMPDDLKKVYLQDLSKYQSLYMEVYNSAMNMLKDQEKTKFQEFGDDNSLDARIK